jgi:hypothetical protein
MIGPFDGRAIVQVMQHSKRNVGHHQLRSQNAQHEPDQQSPECHKAKNEFSLANFDNISQ